MKNTKPISNQIQPENIVPQTRMFKENEVVLYRNVFSNYVKLILGKILKKLGNIRYLIIVNGIQKHAQVDQLRKSKTKYFQSQTLTYCDVKRNRLRSENARKLKEEEL